MDWEKLKAFFTDERMQLYVKESIPVLDKENEFLGKKLFPLKTVNSLEVEIESTKTPIKTKILIPSKEIKDHLKEDSNLMMFAESEEAREAIAKQVTEGVSSLNKILEFRNEKEVWDMLTIGTVQILKNKTLAVIPIPFEGLVTRNGICYHTATNWFNADGTVNAGADILGDIKTFIEWQTKAPRGGPAFTKMIMNRTTLNALLENTALNTTNIPGMIPFRDDYAFNSNLKSIYGLELILYDKVWNNNGATVKYVPDYYVIFLPENIGVRFIAPNPYNYTPSRYAAFLPPEGSTGFWYEVGETSFPLTNTLKTHGVMWVKSLS